MKNRYLYKYFWKNALHNFLFWLVLFAVVVLFLYPFARQINKLMELSQSSNSQMTARMLLDLLNFNLYFLGFFLAPPLGIIAGRALVNKEGEVLLAHRISRRDFYLGSFLFYGLLLLSIWAVFVGLYLMVTYIFNQPFTTDLVFKLVISAFGILLPFLWVGFLAVTVRPVAAIMIYLIIFLAVPSVATVALPEKASASTKAMTVAAKVVSMTVPQAKPFQMIASPFSKLDRSAANLTSVKLFSYGTLWSVFLLLSGFLIYRKKDMIDPHA